jgi:hypothetical protein
MIGVQLWKIESSRCGRVPLRACDSWDGVKLASFEIMGRATIPRKGLMSTIETVIINH